MATKQRMTPRAATPGPWKIRFEIDSNEPDPARRIASIRTLDGVIEVARVEVYGGEDADARLVAEAPWLRDALDALLLSAWGLFNRGAGTLPKDVSAQFARAARDAHAALDALDGGTSAQRLATRFAEIEGGAR